MSVYIDASALVALFVDDPLSARAHASLTAMQDVLIVSDFAALEFSASIQRFARADTLSKRDARLSLQRFDAWAAASCDRAETIGADISSASALVRREDVALRSADAVHVAIAQRLGARLLTFDKKLASNAKRLGLPIA